MAVGLLVEGLPDIDVLQYFAERIAPGIAIKPRALGSKPDLIEGCGTAAKIFLETGCTRVIIAWDLHPYSRRRTKQRKRDKKQRKSRRLNCKVDCEKVTDSLQTAGADLSKVHLVCIDAMLETWLLMDHRGLRDFLLSRGGLREPVKPVPKLRQNQHPKDLMKKLFREKSRSGLQYNDVDDAIKIARKIPVEDDDLKRLKRLDSFSRFASILALTNK